MPTVGAYEKRPYSRAGAPGAVAAGALNTPLPFGAPIDANSAAICADIYASMQADTPGFDASAAPVYIASPGDSTYTVTASGIGGSTTVKAPAGMVAGPAGDSPLEIWDNETTPGTYKQVRCWKVTAINDAAKTIAATNLGVTGYGPSSDGTMTQGVGTGSGLALSAGMLRGYDISDGAVLHALRCSGPSYTKGTFRAPAVSSDQGGTGGRGGASGALEMGVRVRLKSSVDPNSRVAWNPDGASPAVQAKRQAALTMVCRALQTYGFVIEDGTGDPDGFVFQLELDAATYGGTADWNALVGQRTDSAFREFYGWLFRDNLTGGGPGTSYGIPWGQLEVVASGTPTLPSVTTGSASSVTGAGADIALTVNPQYDTGFVSVQYGPTTSYGFVAAPPVAVTPDNSSQNYSRTLTSLNPSTTYHYRAVFTGTRHGTYNGSDQTFTTAASGGGGGGGGGMTGGDASPPPRRPRRYRHGGGR